MRFAVLGGVHAWRDGLEIDLGPRQPRLILAMLLARGGRPVSTSELIDLLWTEDPPPTALNVLHRHIGAIRRAIEPGLARRAEGRWLTRSPGGYRLATDAGLDDLPRFRERAAFAAQQLKAGRRGPALDAYREALELWRGRFGEGLDVATHPAFVAVNRERSAVAIAAADALLGAPERSAAAAASILPGLLATVAAEPFDEALQARLLLLLAAAGRQAEAIERFHQLRGQLATEFGVGPSEFLNAAFRAILQEPPSTPVATVPNGLVPAELPPSPAMFLGRRWERAALDRLLDDDAGRSVVVVALDGLPGAGKSALALRWAHDVSSRFPGGHFFVDLRGFDPDGPLSANDALAHVLGAAGWSRADLPPTTEARAAQFRTLTAGKRCLILLDDAHDSDQVRPLIPAGPGSLVIVTSRAPLTGLAAADGARLFTVGVPSLDDARAQVLARVGRSGGRLRAATVDRIVDRCGRLPLALAVVGAHLTAYAPVPAQDVADHLDRLDGLDAIAGGDPDSDLRAAFARSYRRLSPAAAALFHALAEAGSEVDRDVAAGLGCLSCGEAATLLSELAGTGLLTRTGSRRYELHELIRAYAAELSARPVTPRRKLARTA